MSMLGITVSAALAVSSSDCAVCFHTGAYTAKRYALWQSRQAVLNAQLTGPTGASNSRLDTETAAADAIAALGQFIKTQCCPKVMPPQSTDTLSTYSNRVVWLYMKSELRGFLWR